MELSFQDRQLPEPELDWSEQWVYETVAKLGRRTDAETQVAFLAELSRNSEREKERVLATRLLGAFGVRSPLHCIQLC